MRYHVVYLGAGERQTTHLEAPDAAAAVAAVQGARGHGARAFELLAVAPAPDPAPAAETGEPCAE